MSSFGMPLIAAYALRCSSSWIVSHNASCWGQYPSAWNASDMLDRTSYPPTCTYNLQKKLNAFPTIHQVQDYILTRIFTHIISRDFTVKVVKHKFDKKIRNVLTGLKSPQLINHMLSSLILKQQK